MPTSLSEQSNVAPENAEMSWDDVPVLSIVEREDGTLFRKEGAGSGVRVVERQADGDGGSEYVPSGQPTSFTGVERVVLLRLSSFKEIDALHRDMVASEYVNGRRPSKESLRGTDQWIQANRNQVHSLLGNDFAADEEEDAPEVVFVEAPLSEVPDTSIFLNGDQLLQKMGSRILSITSYKGIANSIVDDDEAPTLDPNKNVKVVRVPSPDEVARRQEDALQANNLSLAPRLPKEIIQYFAGQMNLARSLSDRM